MIEESKRLIHEDLSSNIEEIEENISLESKAVEMPKTNIFFIQLLICSLLVWSLLFLKDSSYGEQFVSVLHKMLSQNINIAPVDQVIEALSTAVKQIL